jgi:hypothetical protein
VRLDKVLQLLFFLFSLCAACGTLQLGDPTKAVEIHNASDVPLVVFDEGRNRWNEGWVIQPGETSKAAWIIPTPGVSGKLIHGRRVEAEDLAGNRVFCRYYNYEELKDAGWRVELTKGDIQC